MRCLPSRKTDSFLYRLDSEKNHKNLIPVHPVVKWSSVLNGLQIIAVFINNQHTTMFIPVTEYNALSIIAIEHKVMDARAMGMPVYQVNNVIPLHGAFNGLLIRVHNFRTFVFCM